MGEPLRKSESTAGPVFFANIHRKRRHYDPPAYLNHLVHQENCELIFSCLTEKQRTACAWRAAGYSTYEIGDIMGTSGSAASQLLRNARVAIARAIPELASDVLARQIPYQREKGNERKLGAGTNHCQECGKPITKRATWCQSHKHLAKGEGNG